MEEVTPFFSPTKPTKKLDYTIQQYLAFIKNARRTNT